MSEEIKGLIEKIQKEGIDEAHLKARQIEEQAKTKAASIIDEAKLAAQKIISNATQDARKTQESTSVALSQAARDMLLSLRRQINEILGKIITTKIHEALSADELSKIIINFIKENAAKSKEDIVISIPRHDAHKLEGLIGELIGHIKKGVIINPADDLQAGFLISFDAGRSQFDFSDKALAEYIGTYLKPKLKETLQQATSQN